MENLPQDLLPILVKDTASEPLLGGREDLPPAERSKSAGDLPKQKKSVLKVNRKNARKVVKMGQIVSRQVGVKVTTVPTEWVVVWGVGLGSGIPKAKLMNYFLPEPAEIRMFVDQTYLFLRFRTASEAFELRDKFHGKSYDERQTLYISFLEKNTDESLPSMPGEDISILWPFDEEPPEGLSIYPNWVTEEEAELIMKKLFVEEAPGAQLKKRTVQHFGYEFRYGSNDVDPTSPLPQGIPDYIKSSVKKMVEWEVVTEEPDQLTVNQYQAGGGIPPHCDTHSCFEGPIVSLSLGSDIVMDFRQAGKMFSVVLPARSLLVMEGPSRYGWTHGITPRKWDIVPDKIYGGITVLPRQTRLSLTFRRLQRGPTVCACDFPTLCDSQKGKITSENAPLLEDALVHKVYDDIADHFTETRHKPWPTVKEFVMNLAPGDKLLDVGCANGKYFGINPDILEAGIDMSMGLLKICYEKGNEVVRANALCLPFRDNYFEGVISIAVLHHLSTLERRLQFVKEIMRVMAPGGVALIYVWSKKQEVDDSKSTWSERQSQRSLYNPTDVSAEQTADFSFLPIHNRDSDFPRNDMVVPWVDNQDKQGAVHHRYYHVFDEGELEKLVMGMTPSPTILESFYEQGNWVVKFQKPS